MAADVVVLQAKIIELEVKIARLEEKLIASDRALDLARDSLEVWKEHSNRVREQILDERRLFFTVGDSKVLELRVAELEKNRERSTGKEVGADNTWVWISIVVGILISVISLYISVTKLRGGI